MNTTLNTTPHTTPHTTLSTHALTRVVAVVAATSVLGLAPLAVAATPAHAGGAAPTLRSGGDDDPPGDDHGGRGGDDSTHDSTDDNGTHDNGDDNGGLRGGDDRVITTGSCSAGADWKLKVKTDDGRLEVEVEVDSNRAGQTWAWTLRHNGSVSARGTSTTTARSGSFDVERKIVNLAGTDRVVFRATYAGQTCRGVVNF
ncbi:hypothetical protein ASC64_00015 [Nocardioides sp. Root122]|uniref:hypothetical protein n=1 Tax=Nocardioides TaxID=1839 RepID=UPI0007031DEF|nr:MULTISPECIES: hypothetical protein [Nocardioides]KQV77284.1 hypothetical protein ASC64_00015 [Nocardioides sp. Root122]MCK9825503.1 hypothetical protein [Nocardioides cavernae]